MMSSKQWIQRGVLCSLLLVGVFGCSMVPSPPSQIAPTNHAALGAWYDKEAAQLRQKAKDMEAMTQRYLKYPQLAHIEGGLPPKADFIQHCSALGALYTKGAEEAEALSRQHRSMVE